jgi:peptidoglycan/LPS O-acetylase OafA/YrhL
MKDRLSAPDGVRVIAIGLVMWFHIWQQSWLSPVLSVGGRALDLTAIARTGYIWVDIMLMLSGYLLFLPLARGKELRAKEYYVRRLIRIVPCYYLSVFVMLFAFALPNHEYATRAAMWKDLLTHLTFTHTFFMDTYVSTRLNVVLWTLAIEVQFYLIFPLVARAFKARPLATYAGMALFSVLFRALFIRNQPNLDIWINQLPAMLDVYANGMLAAYITSELEKREDTKLTMAFFTALTALALVGMWRIAQGQYADSFPLEARKLGQLGRRFELSALGALLLVSCERSFLFIRNLFGNPVTRFLSFLSYNAYIWHQVLSVKLKAWKIPNYVSESPSAAGERGWQVNYTIICFVLSILLAAAITYLFERPITEKLTKKCARRS